MRILIATGGAGHSELAVRMGALLADPAGPHPTILTVIPNPEKKNQAENVIAKAKALLAAEVPEGQGKIREGSPAGQILAEAEEGRYDLVVIGEKREHALMTRLLGSTARKVVENAPCPVLIAKGHIAPIHRILVCDSGAGNRPLLQRFTTSLRELAEEPVEVVVLHVMSQITADSTVPNEQLEADAQQLIRQHTPEGVLLQEDGRILDELNVRAELKVRHGPVLEEIRDEAQRGNYDLLVIGAHQSAGWQRFLLEDIAYQIIEQADRPVLIVR